MPEVTVEKSRTDEAPSKTEREAASAQWRQTVMLYIGSALIALGVGAILIIATSPDLRERWSYFLAAPWPAISGSFSRLGEVYWALLTGAIGRPENYAAFFQDPNAANARLAFTPISETMLTAAPLIVAGVGVAIAFRAGLINVGGPGQGVLGALTAATVGFSVDLPFPVPLLLALVAAMAVGASWGALAGWLKARFGAHEVVTTIMLNYIATNLVVLALGFTFMHRPGRSDPITPEISHGAQLPHLIGDDFRVNFGILIALVVAFLFWLVLRRTPQGLELRAVGQSRQAATALGVNHRRVWISAMAASGGLVALGAAIHITGLEHAMTPGAAGALGIDALVVALLGRTGPLGVCVAGLVVGGMRVGGTQVQALTGVPYDVVNVMQAVLVLMIATPLVAKTLFRLNNLTIKPSTTHGWAA